ncbi:MAG: rRNA maturation RNase YbeY [Chloroflexota bacterium]
MIFLKIDSGLKGAPDQDLLERAARLTLDSQAAPDADLTLVLSDDERLRALNRDFLDQDHPTDVLSFHAGEEDPETGRMYLGDVIISLARAEAQSSERGHPLEAELQLLVVHGVLHLLGFDHAEDDEKARMWAAQATALEQLGLSPEDLHA